MPLIACPECDRQVSTRATRCPGCGNPIADAPLAAAAIAVPPAHPSTPPAKPSHRSRSSSAHFYSPAQIRGAALFGTILCGCHLIAANWRRLGRPDAASKTWIWGVTTFLAAFLIGQFVPVNAAAQFGLATGLIYMAVAERLQKEQRDIVAKRVTEGARTASGWLVFVLVLCYLLAVCGAIAMTLL